MFINPQHYTYDGYDDYGSRFSSWRRRHDIRSPSSAIAKVTKEVLIRPVQQVSRLTQKIGEKTGIKPLTKIAKATERMVLLPANVLMAQTAKREERAGYRKEAKKGLRNVAITAAVVGGAVYGPALWAAHPAVAGVATGIGKTVAIGAGTSAITGAIARKQGQEEFEQEGVMQEGVAPDDMAPDDMAPDDVAQDGQEGIETGLPSQSRPRAKAGQPMSMMGNGKIPVWMIGAIGVAFIYMIWEGRSKVRR